MRAAIVANGRLVLSRDLRERLQAADLLICADGGLRVARRLGARPDVAIGDFDSVSPALREWAKSTGAAVIPHPTEKDKTDAELALGYAIARGVREVDFYGALGGRLDHILANIALLMAAKAHGVHARIVHGNTEAFLAGRVTPLEAGVGDLVSLLALSDVAAGVTTRGLKYPLHNAVLHEGSSLGVSNQVRSLPASVSVRRGHLMVVVTHRRRTTRRRRSA